MTHFPIRSLAPSSSAFSLSGSCSLGLELLFLCWNRNLCPKSVLHAFFFSFVICLSDHFDSANKWHRTKFQEFSFPTSSAEKPQMVIFAVTWLTDQHSAPATMVKITYHIELKDMEAQFHRFTGAQGTATRRHTHTGRDWNRHRNRLAGTHFPHHPRSKE